MTDSPQLPGAAASPRAGRVPPGVRTVDIHCHVSAPQVDELVRPWFRPEHDAFTFHAGSASEAYNRRHFAEIVPKLQQPEERLRDMDRMGIAVQAISVAPPEYHYWTDPELGAQVARIQNDYLAHIVDTYPGRFVGLGTVPLQDVARAQYELERIVADLGFRGIEICTSVNGADLDHPRFLPFFERVQELGLLVLAHPNGFPQGDRLGDYYLVNTIGMPLDSTVFLARTILSGLYERLPELRMCIVHGGGYLPSYFARYDHAWRVRPDARAGLAHPPSHYLRRLYFDTVVYDPRELAGLVERYGADHLLLGTDYPYDMGEDDPVGLICSVEGLSDDDRRLILGENAARLLAIPDWKEA